MSGDCPVTYYDGGITINGVTHDYPIDELVLNPGAEKFVFPHGTSKYKLWDQLPYKYTNLLPESKYIPLFNLIRRNNND